MLIEILKTEGLLHASLWVALIGLQLAIFSDYYQPIAKYQGSVINRVAGGYNLAMMIMVVNRLGAAGEASADRWQQLASNLTHLGQDPNWRNQPSILDQLRGWRISKGSKVKPKAIAASIRA